MTDGAGPGALLAQRERLRRQAPTLVDVVREEVLVTVRTLTLLGLLSNLLLLVGGDDAVAAARLGVRDLCVGLDADEAIVEIVRRRLGDWPLMLAQARATRRVAAVPLLRQGLALLSTLVLQLRALKIVNVVLLCCYCALAHFSIHQLLIQRHECLCLSGVGLLIGFPHKLELLIARPPQFHGFRPNLNWLPTFQPHFIQTDSSMHRLPDGILRFLAFNGLAVRKIHLHGVCKVDRQNLVSCLLQ